MRSPCLKCAHTVDAHTHGWHDSVSYCSMPDCPCRRYRSSRWVSPTGLLGAVGLVSVAVAGLGVVDAVWPGGLG